MTQMSLPALVEGELPLSVPPISPVRALKNEVAVKATIENNNNYNTDDQGWKDEQGNFNGTSIMGGIVNPYTNMDHLQTLERGGCLFSFCCSHKLSPYEAEMVDCTVNLSAFKDEVKENYVPHFDVFSRHFENVTKQGDGVAHSQESAQGEEEQEIPFSFLLARASYLLVGVALDTFLGCNGPVLLSSLEYHQSCQPNGTKVWTDYENMEPNNFRITKPIIPLVYSMTVQFQASAITNQEVLKRLGRHVGTRIDGGILLERTKRTKPPTEDATKKAKSLLLYTDLGSHVLLVTHLTVVLQKGLPDPVERLINYLPNKFQRWGLGETCETVYKTRKYLKQVQLAIKGDGEEAKSVISSSSEDDDKFEDAQSSFDGTKD